MRFLFAMFQLFPFWVDTIVLPLWLSPLLFHYHYALTAPALTFALTKYIPVCNRTSDPSLKAVDHPKFGKILIARRALKKPYHAAWWGTLTSMKQY